MISGAGADFATPAAAAIRNVLRLTCFAGTSEPELQHQGPDELPSQAAESPDRAGRLTKKARATQIHRGTRITEVWPLENVIDIEADIEIVFLRESDVLRQRSLRPDQTGPLDGIPAESPRRVSRRIRKRVDVPHGIFERVVEPVADLPVLHNEL